MQLIGRVAAILNDVHVLLELPEGFIGGEEITVYGNVALPENRPADVPLESIYFPKGQVRILAEQPEKGFFLAERFRDEKERRVRKSLGLYGSLLNEQEVIETVRGDWSAALNKDDALNVTLDRQIRVGDAVGL
jgi:hypothetical protein